MGLHGCLRVWTEQTCVGAHLRHAPFRKQPSRQVPDQQALAPLTLPPEQKGRGPALAPPDQPTCSALTAPYICFLRTQMVAA